MHSLRSISMVGLVIAGSMLSALIGTAAPVAATATPDTRAQATVAAQAESPALTISPASWDFGSVLVGESSDPVEFTLTNQSGVDYDVDEVGFFVTATNHFRIVTGSSDLCSGQALPAQASCTFEVTFTPQASGPRTTILGVQLEGVEVPLPRPGSHLSGSAPMPVLRITPASDVVDFGAVRVGAAPASRRFSVSNDGEPGSVLKIVGITIVYDDSGFTRVDGALPVALDIGDDPFEFDVEFEPEDAGAHRAMMYIAATGLGVTAMALLGDGVAPDLTMTPASHDFGDVAVDASRSKVFSVSNAGSAGLTGLQVAVTGGDFSIVADDSDCDEVPSLDVGETCQVKVRYRPGELGGDTGQLSATANDGQSDSSGLEGTGVPAEDDDPSVPIVAVSPDEWDFGTVEIETSTTKGFTVRNTGDASLSGLAVSVGSAFAIRAADSTCDDIGSLAPDETCSISVEFGPATPGARSGALKVQSTNAANGTVNVPLAGLATPHPSDVSVGPASHDFGDVVFRGTRTQAFSVTNGGGIPVTVTGVTRTGSSTFSVLGADNECLDETLGEGESCTFRVRFRAPSSTAGTKSGTIRVTGSGFDEIVVPVRATAERFRGGIDAYATDRADKPSNYEGVGVACSSSCAAQQAIERVARGMTFTYRVRVRNTGNGADDIRIRLTQTGSKSSIRRIQVLRNGNQDITARVTDGSYVAKDVNPGAEVYLWVRVTVKSTAVPGRVNYIAISGQSTRMPRVKDVARLRTTVR